MSRMKCLGLLAAVILLCQTSSVFAIVGIGAHYGIDMTLSMDNKLMEQTTFDSLRFSLKGLTSLPNGYDTNRILSGSDIPIFINRKNWQNTGINFGGKLYIDILPFIDALEVSTNFGVWQYEGSVLYPSSISAKSSAGGATKFSDLVNVQYDTMPVSLKKLYPNRFFWGVDQTPYAKLHFDATIRKYFLQIPPILKTFKLYGGAGVSLDFATPMLSSSLIEDAVGSTMNNALSMTQMSGQIFNNTDVMKKIIDQIIDNMMTPHYGCLLAAGAMLKLPLMPLGFYVDAKFNIPLDKLDKYVDIGGYGFLINIGAALAF